MSALLSIFAMIFLPIGIGYIESRIEESQSRAFMKNRLAIVIQEEFNPELASAWLNRLAIRSRLQKLGMP